MSASSSNLHEPSVDAPYDRLYNSPWECTRSMGDTSHHILIVEDEAKTASTVALYLRDAGMQVSIARTGDAGLEMARSGKHDLVVLDVMLPGIDGLEVCRGLRAQSSLPVILLTARTTEQERIDGLELGADDYVPKPFSPRELVARVRAVLRRTDDHDNSEGGALERGSLRVDPVRREVRIGDEGVDLTRVEFDLLLVLAGTPGRVWTRRQLIDKIFPDGRHVSPRTVDAHVKNLRGKIEPNRAEPRMVQTVFGVGYRFAEDN
jgi:DNA-binding response OmpR family regulator